MPSAERTTARPCRIDLPRKYGRWCCTRQGDYLKLHFEQAYPAIPKNATRGACGIFTPASRKRMLDRINRIDWSRVRRGMFCTFTYPDECRDRTVRERTQDRFLMWRHLEKHMGREVPLIWRVEWQRRKTGALKGEVMPHQHLVVLDYEYLPWQIWNDWWCGVLGRSEYTNTDVRRLNDGLHCAKYIAKYIAKPHPVSLVVNAYLNRWRGRGWGILRPGLVPWAREESLTDLDPALVRYAHGVACDLWRRLDRDKPDSFTLYGKAAQIAWEAILQRGLDDGCPAGYDLQYQEGKGPEANAEHLA